MSTIGRYAKAVAGAAVAAGTAAITALQDSVIDPQEWVTIIITGVVALGAVWAVPNTPGGVRRVGKMITGAIVAGLGAFATALPEGVTNAEIIVIVIAVLGALGVTYTVPNALNSDGLPR